MNNRNRTPFTMTAASALVLAATTALAQEADTQAEEPGEYKPLALEHRPPPIRLQGDYAGAIELGLAYTSDDNYMFGQYNGLQEDEVTIIGNLQWQDFSRGESYWQASMTDLGLDTREGQVTWGKPDRLRVSLGFDSQQQVRNNSGRTPFRGGDNQLLPDNWVSGSTTSDWTVLDESLRQFDRELDRDRFFLEASAKLSDRWRMETSLSYEEKEGNGDTGGAIYTDASAGDAVLLRSPVDYRTTEFDIGLAYSGQRLHLDGHLAYSDFDNKDDLLSWQNPYSSFGPRVRYPEGVGGLGLAPDNDQVSGRLTGHYIFSSDARLQFDGSYAVASQDQNYLDYSVNQALLVTEPLPASDFDGEVATSTFNTKLLLRPLAKLNAQLFYKIRDRDYDADRNGYRYIRGDGSDQPGQALTVYNTNHDFRSQTTGAELSYRLPLRSKLSFEYAYEKVERKNAAVEETQEDRYTLAYRIQPWSNFSARMSLLYGDRAADDYEWAQSYYALLDSELINATPENQRYINHPELSQYYLSNRERWEGKVDLSYLPAERWNLNLNLLWRDDDFDESNLGLTESEWGRAHFSVSYTASDTLSGSVYTGYDRFEGDQTSRAFRGGQEKNAFATYPPLPQASDPQQDWDINTTDSSFTVGTNLLWQPVEALELSLDYSYVDTTSEQDYSTRPGGSVSASDLPDVDTTLHHFEASGTWHLREALSLRLHYQYYDFDSNDWAWNNVQADTIGKVLTFGQDNPNEEIHYVGASVIYRWQ
jgi:MtrB/PioB family decaheme-associated outer membrane protein